MPLPQRIRGDVAALLEGVTRLKDRLDAEPELDDLRRTIASLQNQLRNALHEGPEPVKAAAVPPPRTTTQRSRSKVRRRQRREPQVDRHLQSVDSEARAAPAPELDAERRPERIRTDTRWQVLGLVREDVRAPVSAVVLFQRLAPDGTATGEFRVWCREIFAGDSWSFIPDVTQGGGRIELDFPADTYEGMPTFLTLEVPRQPRVGMAVRMFREDGKTYGTFRLRSVDELDGKAAAAREAQLK